MHSKHYAVYLWGLTGNKLHTLPVLLDCCHSNEWEGFTFSHCSQIGVNTALKVTQPLIQYHCQAGTLFCNVITICLLFNSKAGRGTIKWLLEWLKKILRSRSCCAALWCSLNLWNAGSVTQTGFEASDYICAIRVLQTALLRMLITSTGCPIGEMKCFIIYKGNLY